MTKTLALLMITLGLGLTQSAPRTELVGYAVLPADTFAPGPASGQFNSDGSKKASSPYPSQPVQGFSAM
ncbi:hypothetical protein [Allomeiothermus silvanus]|uniref:hypothetical protein n=1 Tax=Allomeiothermus silvanus TaxID=52022 RepID=UPI0023F402B2|nr:hypothetical protein [Allomeiothermus silvanus]